MVLNTLCCSCQQLPVKLDKPAASCHLNSQLAVTWMSRADAKSNLG